MGHFYRRIVLSIALLSWAALSCGSCTRAELIDKADAYDQAIWDSNNKQILINAVRASQRAPMSFVGYGDMVANPNFSGNAGGAFNFSPSGLTSYALNPTVAYNGGFSTFTINNLNYSDFAKAMHTPIDNKLVKYFHEGNWPKEMVDLLLIHSIETTKAKFEQLEFIVKGRCAAPESDRTDEICRRIDKDRDEVAAECPGIDTAGPELTILNSAREHCSMIKFQYALRMIRLLNKHSFPGKPRSPEGILYYLGELIAAQNYSAHPYTPTTYLEAGGQRRLVPLFVVERGVSATAAVQVFLNGEGFYIPRPHLGTDEEERSLQVLDLVSQAIVMATAKDALPKSNSVSLVTVR